MRNRIFFAALFAVAIFSVTGCFKNWHKTDCCKDYPYEMHISAMGLMQACRELVANKDVSICSADSSRQKFSVMSASGFGKHESGVVSFTDSYFKDSTIFRIVWRKGDFASNGPCSPNPNIFPFDNVEENHIYELGLIPVANYKAAPTNFPGGGHIRGIIKTQDITAIENIRLEPTTGYINTHVHALYNHERSSNGFICDVTYIRDRSKQDTATIPCYIINNYDGDGGTLRWKVRKECQ